MDALRGQEFGLQHAGYRGGTKRMFEGIVIAVVSAVVVAVVGALMERPRNWVLERVNAGKGIYIDTRLERGPTSYEYGFTETAVKVTLRNETGRKLTIQDIRLMVCGAYGIPIPSAAPVPRCHPTMPADIETESGEIWYFGAEQVVKFFHYSLEPNSKRKHVKVRPKFTTAAGKVFKGAPIRLSTDANAYWP